MAQERVGGRTDVCDIIEALRSDPAHVASRFTFLVFEIITHKFPKKFNVGNIEKYNGDTKPDHWLAGYLTAIALAGGDDLHALRCIPLQLCGSARAWLNSIPANTVYEWPDFQDVLLTNFQGTYQRPASQYALGSCVQRDGEKGRAFIACWLKKKNTIETSLMSRPLPP